MNIILFFVGLKWSQFDDNETLDYLLSDLFSTFDVDGSGLCNSNKDIRIFIPNFESKQCYLSVTSANLT